MKRLIKILFFAVIVKPLVLIGLGLNIVNRKALPKEGPAIIAANHTSHLDTLVLMSLYPLKQLHRVRPIAAADYFHKNRWIKWFATYCIDIIPLTRNEIKAPNELFSGCYEALDHGDIVILFPEGTRSSTEDRIFKLKRGIHYLATRYDNVPVYPVILRGLGKALPKGEALFVPFNCDVVVGDALILDENAKVYLDNLEAHYQNLLKSCITK